MLIGSVLLFGDIQQVLDGVGDRLVSLKVARRRSTSSSMAGISISTAAIFACGTDALVAGGDARDVRAVGTGLKLRLAFDPGCGGRPGCFAASMAASNCGFRNSEPNVKPSGGGRKSPPWSQMAMNRVLPSSSRKSGCEKSNPPTSMMPISTPSPRPCFFALPMALDVIFFFGGTA